MLKIRRPLGRLIFNMGIAIPGKTVFLIETAPRTLLKALLSHCIWILRNKVQSNLNQVLTFYLAKNAFENAVCTVAAILFIPPCVNRSRDQNLCIPCCMIWQAPFLVGCSSGLSSLSIMCGFPPHQISCHLLGLLALLTLSLMPSRTQCS